ncbi:hypothetical protein GCM10011581_15670 [Saccharopolyspora subtropica]|uniref:ADP-ribosylglycohydrolase n=1 Tax=Saccharopolyspora thermophila TaxID=89367 RepID=A0A917NAZ5_9PSEU|nr:ADP-ribosylglycohydrolase family protein [Saccharopolyspora subtropica]GGI79360.1 hypothetical protein GCM10011581_15670 [Saccharopolyspora subtropica]
MTDAPSGSPLTWADRFRGAMLGGAVGDALGAGVRTATTAEIQQWFGPRGVVDYLPVFGRRGAVTDVTQLTVFTLEALLRARATGASSAVPAIEANHLAWLHTQGVPWAYATSKYAAGEPTGWLLQRRELYSTRNPGGPALCGIGRLVHRPPFPDAQQLDPPLPDGLSDCIAWTAPVAAWSQDLNSVNQEAKAAAGLLTGLADVLTATRLHADVLAQLLLGHGLWPSVESWQAQRAFTSNTRPGGALRAVHAAMFATSGGRRPTPTQLDIEFDTRSGPGDLGVALAAVAAGSSFADAVVIAVNHSGDSAVTGALAGQLAGALHGPSAIPRRWLDELEVREVIETLCQDAAEAFAPPQRPQWAQRYVANPRQLGAPAANTVEGSAEQTMVMPAIGAAPPTPSQGIGAPTFPAQREPFEVTEPSDTGPIPAPRLRSAETAVESTAVLPVVDDDRSGAEPSVPADDLPAQPEDVAVQQPPGSQDDVEQPEDARDLDEVPSVRRASFERMPVDLEPPARAPIDLEPTTPSSDAPAPAPESQVPEPSLAQAPEERDADLTTHESTQEDLPADGIEPQRPDQPSDPASGRSVAGASRPADDDPAAAEPAAVEESVGSEAEEAESTGELGPVDAEASAVAEAAPGQEPAAGPDGATGLGEEPEPEAAAGIDDLAWPGGVATPGASAEPDGPVRPDSTVEPEAGADREVGSTAEPETAGGPEPMDHEPVAARSVEPDSVGDPAHAAESVADAMPETDVADVDRDGDPGFPHTPEPALDREPAAEAEPDGAAAETAPAAAPIARGEHAKVEGPGDSAPSLTERVLGCFLGGALGDAFGADLEFSTAAEITARFGPDGPRGLREAYGVHGAITDDTQMTLFTAEGLIRGSVAQRMLGTEDPLAEVQLAYQRWLHTQGVAWESAAGPFLADYPAPDGWLIEVPGLFSTRAPGKTVLRALQDFGAGRPAGSFTERINDSKGCGGVMRAAPVALTSTDPAAVFRLAARTAALTHSHPAGYHSAGALAVIVQQALLGRSLDDGVWLALQVLETWEDHEETTAMLKAAVELAEAGVPTPQRIAERLGGGWVGEEALAIAVCAALVAGDDVELALRVAVHHDGDSDSTGAICGNIVGALHGVGALPVDWLAELELRDVVEQVALDCVAEFGRGAFQPGQSSIEPPTDEDWHERYPVRPQWSSVVEPAPRSDTGAAPEFPAPKPAPRHINGVVHTRAFEGDNQ